MRTSLLAAVLLLGGTSTAGAQTLASPIAIAADSCSDSRGSCAYGRSGLYFPELGMESRGPSSF